MPDTDKEMPDLRRVADKVMSQLRPGDYVIPLGGDAETQLKDNGGKPPYDETLVVVGNPYPVGLLRKIKRVGAKVECMDKTKMHLRLPPDHELAVFELATSD